MSSSSSSSSSSSFPVSPFALGFATAASVGLAFVLMRGGVGAARSSVIRRWRDSPRSCAVLEHQGVVYLSGQVGDIPTLESCDVQAQTRQTLAKIEDLLAEAGTDKEHVLSSQIWLKSISKDFEGFNEVWNSWVHPTNKGVRACVEAPMARPGILVEIKIIAALPSAQQ